MKDLPQNFYPTTTFPGFHYKINEEKRFYAFPRGDQLQIILEMHVPYPLVGSLINTWVIVNKF